VQDTDVVALPKPWLKNRGKKDVHTYRVHFVGECMALVVAETPRKPTAEQVYAFTDIMVRRHHKAALLSLQQESRPDSMRAVSQMPLTARAH
jgi:ketosteroid isomerase-like protein